MMDNGGIMKTDYESLLDEGTIKEKITYLRMLEFGFMWLIETKRV